MTDITIAANESPEPLMFAIAHHALSDIERKVGPWRDELTAWSSVIVAEFCRHLQDLPIPDGYTFEDAATARADWVIHQWCQGRREYQDRINSTLHPDTIVVYHRAGKINELGARIGTLLDQALRDLDTDLRAAIDDAVARR